LCESTKLKRETVTERCGDYTTLESGFRLDISGSGMSDLSPREIQAKMIGYIDDPDSPDCLFYRLESVPVEACCEGWGGFQCDKRKCLKNYIHSVILK
jgi:hypothetical protein